MDDDATDEAGAPHPAEPLTAAADPGGAHDRALALKDRYLGGGSDPAPLDAAIELERQVVAALGGEPAEQAVALSALANMLATRFEHAAAVKDLEEAVRHGRAALELGGGDHPMRAHFQSNLAAMLLRRYERSRDPEELAESRLLLNEALAAGDTAARPAALAQLAWLHTVEEEGASDVAEFAGRARETAQDMLDQGADPAEAGTLLSNLGSAMTARFWSSGQISDLDQAVEYHLASVRLTPEEHPAMPGRLAILAGALATRHLRTGARQDIDAAIDACRTGLTLGGPQTIARPVLLSNLAMCLHRRYVMTGDIGDLDASIAAAGEAAGVLPDDHADKPAVVGNYANARMALFRARGRRRDAVIALTFQEQMIGRARDAGNRARMQANLAAMYCESAEAGSESIREGRIGRFRSAGARRVVLRHAGRAVTAAAEAAGYFPDGHPLKSQALLNLGRAHAVRSADTGAADEERRARDAFGRVVRDEGGLPSVRVEAGLLLGALAAGQGDWDEACTAFAAVLEILPVLMARELPRADREFWLARTAGTARDAAACALHAGRPRQALTLLEQGRGVLLNELMAARGPLTGLSAAAPELARRFRELSAALEAGSASAPFQPAGMGLPERDEQADRRALRAEFDAVVAGIRALPPFAGFLLPPHAGKLQEAAAEGPVAVLNVSAHRSDALVVTPEEITVVPLPDVTPESVAERAARLPAALRDDQDEVRRTLRWLWSSVVAPLLDRGALPSDGTSRVWWVPTGPLAFLPVHAAQGDDRNALDLFVSSYAPTIGTLARSRADREPPEGGRRVLAVMPGAGGHDPIPALTRERAVLADRFRDALTLLDEEEATPASVRAALPHHAWVHVAGHAEADAEEPSRGRIRLTGGDLTVQDVSELDLAGAELAYLAACETAMPTAALADESVHLASAFLIAGFPQVIATLWPVHDAPAARLTRDVHTALAACTGLPAPPPAARILNAAARRLRDGRPDHPAFWAGHIHTGR